MSVSVCLCLSLSLSLLFAPFSLNLRLSVSLSSLLSSLFSTLLKAGDANSGGLGARGERFRADLVPIAEVIRDPMLQDGDNNKLGKGIPAALEWVSREPFDIKEVRGLQQFCIPTQCSVRLSLCYRRIQNYRQTFLLRALNSNYRYRIVPLEEISSMTETDMCQETQRGPEIHG